METIKNCGGMKLIETKPKIAGKKATPKKQAPKKGTKKK